MITRRATLLLLATRPFDPRLEAAISLAVNRERMRANLQPLLPDDRLRDAARSHSLEMDRRRFFSHVDPRLGDPGERLDAADIRWRRVGENIYQAAGISDLVKSAVRDWMRSEGHRKNILSTRYTHSGVGVVEGRAGLVTITQMFASFSP